MAFLAALQQAPGNKFSSWAKSMSVAAVFGAIGSVVGALGVFGTATALAHPENLAQASPSMLLVTLVGLFFYGVGLVWFSTALMMFTVRSAQFVRDRGAVLKWKAYWGFWGWFVPILSLFVPYLVLRDVVLASESKETAEHRRSLLWFWIWWTVLSGLINVAMQFIQATDPANAFTGWSMFAGVMAFQLVPFMMGRALFTKIDADLRAVLAAKPEEPEISADKEQTGKDDAAK